MGKRKRKLSAAEQAEASRRRQAYQTVFANGKMKRVRRPPTIDDVSVDDFIRANADPIFLHQEELWEYREEEGDPSAIRRHMAAMHPSDREPVEFITTEAGDDLIVAFAISRAELDEIVTLILQRTPKYEGLLPPEERGVVVSHERFAERERELATRIIVDGSRIDIVTPIRAYLLDLSAADPQDVDDARTVLRLMHRHGGFQLDLR